MRVAPVVIVSAVLSFFGASACGGGAPARSRADAEPAREAPVRRAVPIAFEAKKPGSKPLPFPLVEGTVGGQPVRFIVDTGAGVHVIDSAVAAAAKLGSPAEATSISLEGWGPLVPHAVAVRELSASFRAHGIGGIIVPQLLADSPVQAVVVDLVKRQLRASPQSMAWAELEDHGPVLTPPGARKFCPVYTAGVPGLVLGMDGKVEGVPSRIEVDTGASHTVFVETSPAGAKAATHPLLGRSVSAGEGDVAIAIHGGVPVTFGAWTTTLDVGVTAQPHHGECGYDGRLGIDVLQQCAIAMTAEKLLVACRAPSAPPAPNAR